MTEVTVTIDGAQVSGQDGMTILELAQKSGIDIPTLCYRPELPPIGACRICVVEMESSRTLVGSCHTPITLLKSLVFADTHQRSQSVEVL